MHVLALILLAVNSSPAADSPEVNSKLTVSLSWGKKSDVVHAVYHNGTDQEVRIDRQVAENSILALDVVDSSGKQMPSLPPPVPSAERQEIAIAPGKDWSFDYTLDIFDPPLAPGDYRVRIRLGKWKSNDLPYTVGK